MSSIECVLCDSSGLREAYIPPTSALKLEVHVCLGCGLVQSWPRTERVGANWRGSTTANSMFGGLRYGKAFRSQAALERLEGYRPLKFPLMDVGAGRGDFVGKIRNQGKILALEPDELIWPDWCADDHYIQWTNARIEEQIPVSNLRTIVMIHTLEHLAQPIDQLKRLWSWARDGCLLYVEVPNLEIMNRGDFVEEFFIDRHLTHFTLNTLQKMLNLTGWRPVRSWVDQENVAILAGKANRLFPRTDGEPGRALDRLVDYVSRRADRVWLQKRVENLNNLARDGRIAAWGLGRIFDACCRAGLDPKLFVALVDAHLPLTELYGFPTYRPHKLEGISLDAVLVFSREYAKEIAQDAGTLLPGVKIIHWNGDMT